MNKLTNILLGAILVVGLGVLIVGLQPKVPSNITVVPSDVNVEQPLGFGGYNELGYGGMIQTTTVIRIEGNDTSVGTIATSSASTTVYKIFSNNSGRMFGEIEIKPDELAELRLWFGTTTYSAGATTTYASSTKYWGWGKTLASTTGTVYTIGPDNLWQGEVWGVATTSNILVRTREK